MKRLFTLALLTFVAASLAALDPLPADARFDQPVEFKTTQEGESLQTMIAALAKSIDLTAIVDNVPDVMISYDIGDPKPFRQVWEIVLTLNDLDFVLLDNDIVVVGPSVTLQALRVEPSEDPTPMAESGEEITQRVYRVNNDPAVIEEIVQTLIPDIEVQAIPNARAIVARGTQGQLDEVQALLDEFDRVSEAEPRVFRIYTLSNAKAEDLAETLQNSGILSVTQEAGEVAAADGSTQLVSNAATTENVDFTVTADVRTNSLLVFATQGIQARISEIVPVLDTPQPQVNVQVRIQEVTRQASSSLGVNLTTGFGNFATSILDGGLKFIFDAQNAISGLNIGAVLDTLEEQGLSRRVDDSNITVLSNQDARMQSGGRIEITFDGAGGEISTRTIEFGVIITVTPRISDDGRVILEVAAEVSDLLVPLSEGGIPQRIDFSTRQVSSTVTLRPGQTVLLGGLLQNSLTQTTNRVPFLGDLPIVGNLFSRSSVEEENTDLLLIVTADVVE